MDYPSVNSCNWGAHFAASQYAGGYTHLLWIHCYHLPHHPQSGLGSILKDLPLSHHLNTSKLLVAARKMPLQSMNFAQQVTVHFSIFCITLNFAVALYSGTILIYRAFTVINQFTPTQCFDDSLLQEQYSSHLECPGLRE
jgi:hypothetical protein